MYVCVHNSLREFWPLGHWCLILLLQGVENWGKTMGAVDLRNKFAAKVTIAHTNQGIDKRFYTDLAHAEFLSPPRKVRSRD